MQSFFPHHCLKALVSAAIPVNKHHSTYSLSPFNRFELISLEILLILLCRYGPLGSQNVKFCASIFPWFFMRRISNRRSQSNILGSDLNLLSPQLGQEELSLGIRRKGREVFKLLHYSCISLCFIYSPFLNTQ